ncbi:hypothetical protein GALMADRAFT_246294 [Galerina marginata CBS 339.88]|uniref:Uncharacterized protein n=1 Tax=Galerina marginata (strain CBS 339.88) TaxID=685588 RepID=A0A067TDP0_GALM3|nr:hypothetical protein GALMADRAFT_246294 [Galerina marginata CBS 339.88]
MHACFLRVFLLLGSLAVVLAAEPDLQLLQPLNPDPESALAIDILNEGPKHAVPQVDFRPMTNARRFAAGLPPLPPKRRATATTPAHRPSPSAVPPSSPSQAYIEVREATTRMSLGFISSKYNAFGEGGLTTHPNDRMAFALPAPGGPMSLTTINGPNAKYPVFGGIKGFSSSDANIGPASSNYATLGSTIPTTRNSPPVTAENTFSDATGLPEPVESAIWTYDPASGTLTPQWVNANSSAPTPSSYAGYTGDFLVLTGDPAAFANTYGATTWVVFTIVPVKF